MSHTAFDLVKFDMWWYFNVYECNVGFLEKLVMCLTLVELYIFSKPLTTLSSYISFVIQRLGYMASTSLLSNWTSCCSISHCSQKSLFQWQALSSYQSLLVEVRYCQYLNPLHTIIRLIHIKINAWRHTSPLLSCMLFITRFSNIKIESISNSNTNWFDVLVLL